MVLVFMVVGVLSVFMAVGMALAWAVTKKEALLLLAPCYAGFGALLLGVRAMMLRGSRGSTKHQRDRHSSSQRAGAKLEASHPESGAAFILVMVLLALLTTMLLQSQWLARSSHLLQEGYLLEARLRASATKALQSGLQRLANYPELQVDSLTDEWAKAV
jgi:hypothetical protein